MTIWPRRDPRLYHVFRLPDELPEGYCFGGGKPCSFTLVDWFGLPPAGMFDGELTNDDIAKFLREKDYYKQGGNFVVICNDGQAFTLEGGQS
ncbi:hypothetical protein [Thalassospira lohafexi]|uniref:Uncharacterized protein n=1 Tax=Thalassospira lohafexi TaxID=744227 RepID=A0A2N3L0P5_9PROT|nr:hypothetical protein [Thalassospira lohafexi]PKR56385.1 hypothetical protein COO92_21510 [Thalassospira lohafexi]